MFINFRYTFVQNLRVCLKLHGWYVLKGNIEYDRWNNVLFGIRVCVTFMLMAEIKYKNVLIIQPYEMCTYMPTETLFMLCNKNITKNCFFLFQIKYMIFYLTHPFSNSLQTKFIKLMQKRQYIAGCRRYVNEYQHMLHA